MVLRTQGQAQMMEIMQDFNKPVGKVKPLKRATFHSWVSHVGEFVEAILGSNNSFAAGKMMALEWQGKLMVRNIEKGWDAMPKIFQRYMNEVGWTKEEFNFLKTLKKQKSGYSNNEVTINSTEFDKLKSRGGPKGVMQAGETAENFARRFEAKYRKLEDGIARSHLANISQKNRHAGQHGTTYGKLVDSMSLQYFDITHAQFSEQTQSLNRIVGMDATDPAWSWATNAHKNPAAIGGVIGSAVLATVAFTWAKDLANGRSPTEIDLTTKEGIGTIVNGLVRIGLGNIVGIMYENAQFGGSVLGDTSSAGVKPLQTMGGKSLTAVQKWMNGQTLTKEEEQSFFNALRKLIPGANGWWYKTLLDKLIVEGFGIKPREMTPSYRRYLKEKGSEYTGRGLLTPGGVDAN